MFEQEKNMTDRKGRLILKGYQLMILFTVFVIGIAVTGIAGVGIKSIPGITEKASLMLTAAVQCGLAFVVPAWLTAKCTVKKPAEWLSINVKPRWKAIVGVLIVYALAMPAMNQLISWNESVHFPESLQWLEDTLRKSEDTAGAVSGKMLESMNMAWTLAAVAVIGILTGFSEEIFFRGALQKIFMEPGRSGWAIWGAAIIFSAIHFQFFGFVPRMIMGAFFGYILYWTRSLWIAAFAHALNNSIVVVFTALVDGGTMPAGVNSFGVSHTGEIPWDAITSAAATTIFLWKFRKYFFSTTHNVTYGKKSVRPFI